MRWTRFFRRDAWDDERRRELAAHLAHEIEAQLARGLTHEQATAAAHRRLGNTARIREEIYTMNSLGFADTLIRDLRYGARILIRNPTFALVAIVTLALGTGANTTMFQLVDAVRLRALPVAAPDQLAEILIRAPHGRTGSFHGRRPMLSNVLWERIQTEQRVFGGMLAWSDASWDLASGGEIRPASGLYVSGDYFATLGIAPAIGRLIGHADDTRGCADPGAVLGYAFWQRQYGADPAVLGRSIALDGHRFDIIGVAPASFTGVEVGSAFDVALPICAEAVLRGAKSGLDQPDVWSLAAFGRLKPGVSVDQATAQLGAISSGIFAATVPTRYGAADVKEYQQFRLYATPAATGVSTLRRLYNDPLTILLAVTALVLLTACANLANLMLARATAREREIAVRLAIGASRRRVVGQLLAESLVIAVLGAAAGLLTAHWLSAFLVSRLAVGGTQVFVDLQPGWRVLGFTIAVAAAACMLFGLSPALRATRVSLQSAMRAGGRGSTEGRERFGLRRVLVVAQVALSLTLIVVALLFGRSLRNLTHLDPGFRQDGVIVATVDLKKATTPAAAPVLLRQIGDALRGIAGVDEVSQSFTTPVGDNLWNEHVVIDGQEKPALVNFNSVAPHYFRAIGTPVLGGRDFQPTDTAGSPKVALVSETFARTMFKGAAAIGRTFQVAEPIGDPRPVYAIIGVVRDSKYTNLREPFTPVVFLDIEQAAPDLEATFVLHGTLPAAAITPAATHAIAAVSPAIAVKYATVRSQIEASLLPDRLMAALSGCFGALAVLIAAVGLYGVMSYMVARRRMEIGIRMALGADRGAVIGLIVGEAAMLLLIGAVIGTALAIAAGRWASTLLYGLRPWDPVALILGGSILGAVTLLASWLPAWRATHIAPTSALRQD